MSDNDQKGKGHVENLVFLCVLKCGLLCHFGGNVKTTKDVHLF